MSKKNNWKKSMGFQDEFLLKIKPLNQIYKRTEALIQLDGVSIVLGDNK